MSTETKFISLHNRFIRHGVVQPNCVPNGMCGITFRSSDSYQGSLEFNELFQLMVPTMKERRQHYKDGYDKTWWGSLSEEIASNETLKLYTPLRQNIILFCAAMNNEL